MNWIAFRKADNGRSGSRPPAKRTAIRFLKLQQVHRFPGPGRQGETSHRIGYLQGKRLPTRVRQPLGFNRGEKPAYVHAASSASLAVPGMTSPEKRNRPPGSYPASVRTP